MDLKLLIDKAIEGRSRTYSPYSNFGVGASILLKNGEYILGCNVENVSYGLTICAERIALFQLVSKGYNKNDVEATYQFLLVTLGLTDYSIYKNKNKIELREKLKKKFRIPCSNYPDVKIGEQLMLHLYARSTQQEVRDLKEQRTIRNSINLKDCIPKWCNIKSK